MQQDLIARNGGGSPRLQKASGGGQSDSGIEFIAAQQPAARPSCLLQPNQCPWISPQNPFRRLDGPQ
jgi:hypothetical protein